MTTIESQAEVIVQLTQSLKECPVAERRATARKLLIALFARLQGDFEALLNQLQLNIDEESKFLSYLLYCIYHKEIWLPAQKDPKWFLVVLLAECVSEKSVEAFLKRFSDRERSELALYCSLHPREGSWILQQKDKERSWKTDLERIGEKQLREIAEMLLPSKYTLDELRSFFRVFGFQGYPLRESVLDILKTSNEGFIKSLLSQLNAFHREPQIYKSGFEQLVYVLSTRGDNLPQKAWLPTLLEGLKLFAEHVKISLKDHSIIIFDQAAPKLLVENRKFTAKLSKQYGVQIKHLSSRQTLSLAKKWGVEPWIHTQRGSSFGYAGSRNAAFFLAPHISKAKDKAILHLGEDDVALPLHQVFSDALFAAKHRDAYFYRPQYCIGRSTQQVNPLVDLKSLLDDPSRLYSSTHWNNNPFLGGMKGQLTKPRFCLPLPFGNEESHALPTHVWNDPFQQPIFHYSGTRFPQKLFPISPLDGALEYLKSYLPYSFQISMSSNLLNPSNSQGRSVFPWNDRENRENIHSLKELLAFAALPQTQKELQKRFWRNFEEVFKDPTNLFHQCVTHLAEYDPSMAAPMELKRFFSGMQGEAKLILALSQTLNKQTDAAKELAKAEKKLKIKARKNGLVHDLLKLIQCISTISSLAKSTVNAV